ncbi:MAG: hypothetical protein U0703_23250 [Anaerolineae bacterium]
MIDGVYVYANRDPSLTTEFRRPRRGRRARAICLTRRPSPT